MMDLAKITTDSVYQSPIAQDAVYIDRSGARVSVRVIPRTLTALESAFSEVGVRGRNDQVRIRRADILCPVEQVDRLIRSGTEYRVISVEDLTADEWQLNVVAET